MSYIESASLKKAIKAIPTGRCNVRMWAGIWYGKKLIAEGFASSKSHPLQLKFSNRFYKIFVHAEIAALADYLRKLKINSSIPDLRYCIMTIARVKKDNSAGLAKPCGTCQAAILEFGIG